MKKTISFAAIALLTFSGAALADDTARGTFGGSASSFAGSAGGSFGNGNSFSEASQFSGVESTLRFDPSFGEGNSRDGFTGTATTESFTSGFDRARSNNGAFAGALRGGVASGWSEFSGRGRDSW